MLKKPVSLSARQQVSKRLSAIGHPLLALRKRWRLGVVILLAALALGEALARQAWVQALLPPAGRGTHRTDLEVKIERLDALARQGPVRCIALGSSAVRIGFDPEAFSAGYTAQGGSPLPCFNFGLDAYTASGAAPLAEALIRRYRPALVIYATTPSDYSPRYDELYPDIDAPGGWVRAQRGELSPHGWLIEHSYLFRDVWALPWWLDRNGGNYIRAWDYMDEHLNSLGYWPIDLTHLVDEPPLPGTSPLGFTLLDRYAINPADRTALARIVALDAQTQLVVVEIPVADQAMAFFDGGAEDYELFLSTVGEVTQAGGVEFWELPQYELIPPNGWYDYLHLNATGAAAFSDWLGQRTGAAALRGKIDDPAK